MELYMAEKKFSKDELKCIVVDRLQWDPEADKKIDQKSKGKSYLIIIFKNNFTKIESFSL